jgi:hypothetical protein
MHGELLTTPNIAGIIITSTTPVFAIIRSLDPEALNRSLNLNRIDIDETIPLGLHHLVQSLNERAELPGVHEDQTRQTPERRIEIPFLFSSLLALVLHW